MRAIILRAFGGPEVLEVTELERPRPAAGEVLVRVEAIGLNPVEAFARSGALPLFGPPPMVLGWDVAGVVEAVGPGVDRFAAGDRVFGLPRFPRLASGYAEYVTAPADRAGRPPEDPGRRARRGAAAGRPDGVAEPRRGRRGRSPGSTSSSIAGGGGVGHLAVQLAKSRGAQVTATASEGKRDFVAGLGADAVVDYRTEDLASRVRDVDVLLDPIGGDVAEQSVPLVRPGGTIVSLLRHHDEDDLKARIESTGRRFVRHLVSPDAAGLEALTALVDDGTIGCTSRAPSGSTRSRRRTRCWTPARRAGAVPASPASSSCVPVRPQAQRPDGARPPSAPDALSSSCSRLLGDGLRAGGNPARARSRAASSIASWPSVSTPSAVTVQPSARAMSMTPPTMARSPASSGRSRMKLRSILSASKRCCLSHDSDE